VLSGGKDAAELASRNQAAKLNLDAD